MTPTGIARFDGPEYIPSRDHERLSSQFRRIFNLMSDGQWRTLQDITDATEDPQSSVSAQLRHMRKVRFGAHTVNRRHMGDGLFEYQLVANNG